MPLTFQRRLWLGGLLAGVFFLAGCASIISGTTQTIQVDSTPAQAFIYVDDDSVGTTPASITLKRASEHELRIELEGYKPYTTPIRQTINGWVFGNALLGGVIGIAVDVSTGAIYNLTPQTVNPDLTPTGRASAQISVYLHPDLDPREGLRQIGQLEALPASALDDGRVSPAALL
jgi:hypothetical protein